MKFKNFPPWGWIALSLFSVYNGEAFAQQGGYGGYHMGTGMMGEWGMGWFGGIFMIIFWVFIIVGKDSRGLTKKLKKTPSSGVFIRLNEEDDLLLQ